MPQRSSTPRGRGGVGASPVISVADEQSDRPVDAARWRALAERVLEAEGVVGEAELSLHFVDRAAMAELNREHLGGEGPTDVLSFPIDGERASDALGRTGGPPLLLGDVVICPDVASANAPEHAGTDEDELALLVVHGILHLLGHDHAADDERAAMQALERDLLGRLHGVPARDPWDT
jgi:probable rRNA maturation factor